MTPPTIVWFRQDLRLSDNAALAAAQKGPVVPVFVLDDETPGVWKTGEASRWWLHRSLEALAGDLAKRGSRLILRRGRADKVLPELVAETGAKAVVWNRLYEPYAVARDGALKEALKARDVAVSSFNGSLLKEPWEVKTGGDTPFKVFTPFWRAAQSTMEPGAPLPARKALQPPDAWPKSDALAAWKLLPTRPNWASGFEPVWTPGEAGAKARLAAFVDEGLSRYAAARDMPGEAVTSRLSPHLHWGEISPRQVWHALQVAKQAPKLEGNADKFLSEIGWREFSYHLLYHFPTLPEKNFRPGFDAFPWAEDKAGFRAWSRGRTGYPIVDAGMRELWATGTMHNRVRMAAASFLIKHLMIDWRRGAAWFWDTLVDADLASNSASWQWVAGSGADAAPYFRIFNPVLQGEKFDPDGVYTRRWVPELQACDTRFLHRPWDAPNFKALKYAERIVEHDRARARALGAFERLSRG
ncbi:MAG: deoxyribodipyrimidine photo-lyase [Alphaproteobacteria bacterium]|nr:deoxyribodipyrimidine photo-lyase [Alphaproteobacteria bacterium]